MRRATTLMAAGIVAAATFLPATAQAVTKAPTFKNCGALNASYPHGVAKPGARDHVRNVHDIPVRNFTVNAAVYNANARLDADHDGVACEKH